MTNEYAPDSEPHQDYEHAAEEEHAAPDIGHDPGAENQPPFDDFGAAEGAGEETATVSQEAATDGDESAAPIEQKSRSMLPVFAGIGGIVLLGIVVYWQFGHSSSPSAPPMTMAAESPTHKFAPPPASATSPAPANPGDTDIGALYKAPPDTAAVPLPEPANTASTIAPAAKPTDAAATAPRTGMATMPMVPVSPLAASPAGVALPAAPAHHSASPYSQNSATPTPSSAAPPTAWNGNDSAAEARINALSARLDTLQKSLDDQNKQLSQVTNMVAANQTPPSAASNQMNPELQARFEKIDQLLTKLEHDESVKSAPAMETAQETETSSNRETPVRHKVVHKKTKPARHHKPVSSRPAVRMASAAPAWILRAAIPNEAWVSSDPSAPELHHVQVGDTLAGIGTVRSIRQTGGSWEIEGTTGTVR